MNFKRWQFSFSSVQLLFVFLFLLSGCTTYGPSDRFLGLSRQEVITLLGPPRPLPDTLDGARRLDFPRGPMGFRTIKDGMDISEVIERIGVATDTFLIARNRGYVWNYRYENTQCKWFQIEFTAESKVRSAGYGLPPECRRRFMSF
jgi:hypothetical protein